jgi:hypothetical protein
MLRPYQNPLAMTTIPSMVAKTMKTRMIPTLAMVVMDIARAAVQEAVAGEVVVEEVAVEEEVVVLAVPGKNANFKAG